MAQNEIQLPSKADLYRDVKSLANELARIMLKFSEAADFINSLNTADLDAMQVPAGQIRTDLVDFKNTLNEVVSWYNGSTVTPAKVPDTVVDKLRSMIIV